MQIVSPFWGCKRNKAGPAAIRRLAKIPLNIVNLIYIHMYTDQIYHMILVVIFYIINTFINAYVKNNK